MYNEKNCAEKFPARAKGKINNEIKGTDSKNIK